MISKIDKTINEFTIQELVYYAYFALMLFVKGMGLYEGQWPYTLSLVIGAVLILVKLIITEHNMFEWIFIVLLSALSITIYFHSHKLGVLVITATIIGMKKVSVDRLMWIGTIIWSLTFVINIILTLLGIRPDIIMVQEKLGLGHIIRYSLGSTHPNVLQITYMIFCAFILYISNFTGKKLVKISFIMFLGSLYVFMYSVSYTGFAICLFYLVINLYLSTRKRFIWTEKVSSLFVFPILSVGTIWLFNCYDWNYYYYLNKWFNTRPFITWRFMQNNPIAMFGVGFDSSLPVRSNNLDSAYVYGLMHYGYIWFTLFVVVYTALFVYLVNNNKRKELGILIASVLAAITEPFFVNESFKNITWIFVGAFCFLIFGEIGVKKTFTLLKIDKVLHIQLISLRGIANSIKECWFKKRHWLYGASLVLGILVSAFYMKNVTIKSPYYVNRSVLQAETKESVMIDIAELPNDFSGELIKYEGKDVPMVEINSFIGTVEYYRNVISLGLGVAIVALIIGIFIFGIRYEICSKDK